MRVGEASGARSGESGARAAQSKHASTQAEAPSPADRHDHVALGKEALLALGVLRVVRRAANEDVVDDVAAQHHPNLPLHAELASHASLLHPALGCMLLLMCWWPRTASELRLVQAQTARPCHTLLPQLLPRAEQVAAAMQPRAVADAH